MCCLGKTKRQEFMEHLTVEANQLLCQFLQVWSPDALEGQQITISDTYVTIEMPNEQQTIPIGDLLQNVLDPMAGTGSTVLAAMRCGRRAIGIELSGAFARLALTRVLEEQAALGSAALGSVAVVVMMM